jgi:arsenite methyltransferase
MIRPRYGIDAPGFLGWTTGLGIVSGVGAVFFSRHSWPTVAIALSIGSAACHMVAASMVWYSLRGKFRHRDRMIGQVAWRGNEHVLDVGTGRGLLAVAAARRLRSGRAVGIDIWNSADLSGNSIDRAEHNLHA